MPPRLRVPGIVGGAGPGATAQLYLDVMARCRRAGLANRPAVLIASLDIDLAMEERLLREGVGIEGYRESLLASGRALAAAGADFLAIPCNTLHVLLDDLAAAVPVPVLSIVDAVARQVDRRGCRTVGLLSTTTTAGAGLYQDGLRARGITVVGIAADLQRALEERIEAEVAQRAAAADDGLGAAVMGALAAQGAGAVVAGCTELQAVMDGWPEVLPVIDSLDALGALVVAQMTTGSSV